MDKRDMSCICHGVKLLALAETGCSVQTLTAAGLAGTKCGLCVPYLQALITETQESVTGCSAVSNISSALP